MVPCKSRKNYLGVSLFFPHGRLRLEGGPKVLKVQFPQLPFYLKVQIPLVWKGENFSFVTFLGVKQKKNPNF